MSRKNSAHRSLWFTIITAAMMMAVGCGPAPEDTAQNEAALEQELANIVTAVTIATQEGLARLVPRTVNAISAIMVPPDKTV